VIFLPAALLALVAGHLVLMRRQGISGPPGPREGRPSAFYPVHAARDVTVIAVVLGALAFLAWRGVAPLEGPADPTDATYVPRPEWYFLGLFQLLKYFPGKLEIVGAIVLPTVAGALLALLPWIDRGPERRPARRPVTMTAVMSGVLAIVILTALGWRDRPVTGSSAWTVREIAGGVFVRGNQCARCHADAGMADPLDRLPSTRAPEWIAGHVVDPEMIGPGLREAPGQVHEREAAAMVAYLHRLSRQGYPGFDAQIETAAAVFARHCIGCHTLDRDGGTDGPDLSRIGAKHEAARLRVWIADPPSVDPEAEMPSFGRRLTPLELDAIAGYLASRK
jgi:ubiquinol-cytochrome c reductase cytochrome b subunit